MTAQRSELLDGTVVPLFAGVFGIFGHGNVLGLGPALYDVRDDAADLAGPERAGHGAGRGRLRAGDRPAPGHGRHARRSGPGALNMVTAAGARPRQPPAAAAAPGRHVRRPCARPGAAAGRALRRPDDVGQRRLPAGVALLRPDHQPEQLLASLPQVARVLTDPGRRRSGDPGAAAGRAGGGVRLPGGDVRRAGAPGAAAPARRHRRSPRRSPSSTAPSGRCWCSAAESATRARPRRRSRFAETHGVPVVETVAGRTLVPHDHPLLRRRAGHRRLRVRQHARHSRPTWCSRSAPGCRTSPPPRGPASPPVYGS